VILPVLGQHVEQPEQRLKGMDGTSRDSGLASRGHTQPPQVVVVAPRVVAWTFITPAGSAERETKHSLSGSEVHLGPELGAVREQPPAATGWCGSQQRWPPLLARGIVRCSGSRAHAGASAHRSHWHRPRPAPSELRAAGLSWPTLNSKPTRPCARSLLIHRMLGPFAIIPQLLFFVSPFYSSPSFLVCKLL
jgi:hypothetical protein